MDLNGRINLNKYTKDFPKVLIDAYSLITREMKTENGIIKDILRRQRRTDALEI